MDLQGGEQEMSTDWMRHARRNESMGVERTVAASEMLGEVPYCLTTESLRGVVALMRRKHCNTIAS
jgi:hypothetical protein